MIIGAFIGSEDIASAGPQIAQYNPQAQTVSIVWDSLQPTSDPTFFNWSYADGLFSTYEAQGIHQFLVRLICQSSNFAYPPPANCPGASTQPKNLAQYSSMVSAVVSRYQNKVVAWCQENECATQDTMYCIGQGAPFTTRSAAFAATQAALYQAAHAAAPNCVVTNDGIANLSMATIYCLNNANQLNWYNQYITFSGGALGQTSPLSASDFSSYLASQVGTDCSEWWTMYLQNLQFIDALQVHFYAPDELLPGLLAWAHQQMSAAGADKPIHLGEAGILWATQLAGPVNLTDQANWLAKTAIRAAGNDVPFAVWWLWTTRKEAQGTGTLGLIDYQTLQPRPAAAVFGQCVSNLSSATSGQSVNLGSNIAAYSFNQSGKTLYGLWTLDGSTAQVTLPGPSGSAGPQTVTVTGTPNFVLAAS